jgi:hypothetical protein
VKVILRELQKYHGKEEFNDLNGVLSASLECLQQQCQKLTFAQR